MKKIIVFVLLSFAVLVALFLSNKGSADAPVYVRQGVYARMYDIPVGIDQDPYCSTLCGINANHPINDGKADITIMRGDEKQRNFKVHIFPHARAMLVDTTDDCFRNKMILTKSEDIYFATAPTIVCVLTNSGLFSAVEITQIRYVSDSGVEMTANYYFWKRIDITIPE